MIWKNRRAAGVLLGMLLLAASAPAEGAPEASLRLVTAIGRAEIGVAPDRAIASITVRANGKSAGEAARTAASRSAQVLEALRAKLGPGDRAESAGNTLQPEHAYEQGKPPRVTGYVAEHILRLSTARTQEVGVLLDAATGSADVSIDSVRFELADPSTAQANALRLAARDAKGRAAAMAEGLGLGLGGVRSVREVGGASSAPPTQLRMKTAAADSFAETQVLPPQLTVQGEVEVSFELAGAARP